METNADSPASATGSGHMGGIGPDPRDQSANQRTLLAWVRAGVAVIGLGFVVARMGYYLREIARAGGANVPGHGQGTLLLGIFHLVLGFLVIAVAAARYAHAERTLTVRGHDDRRLTTALVLVMTAGSLAGGLGLAIDLLLIWSR